MKTFKKGEIEIKIDKPIKQSGEPVYKTNLGDFTIADLQSQGFTETDSLDDTNTPINSSELEAQSAIEEDISQSQDIIGNKQKLKTNIETSLVKAGEGALANKEFINAVAEYTEGRPATEEEIQKIGSGEGFGLVGAGVNDVLRRFGVAEDFGVLLEPAQAAQAAQGEAQTGGGGVQGTPIEEARDERKDTYEKIADLYRNIKGGLEDIKDETFKEERTALSEAETKLQDTKTELEQMKIMDIKEIEDLKDEPISNAAIRGEMSELSFDQKIDVMMKQQDYNNALVKKSLAQNDLTRARDIIQQTADDYYDNAMLELEALEVEGKYQTSVIERLRNAALEERTFRLNGWTPIDPEQLDTKILEYSKQSGEVPETFTDPVTGQTYIRPRDTEPVEENLSWERIGTLPNGDPKYGIVNLTTNEVIDPAGGEPVEAIVGGYNIGSYATDPGHERKIATILGNIGQFENQSEIDSYIESNFPDSPVSGEMIVNSAGKYGVSWEMMIAIMQQDSSMGTKGKAVRTKNPGNVGNDDAGNLVTYKDWQSGVDAVAKNLAWRKTDTPVESSPIPGINKAEWDNLSEPEQKTLEDAKKKFDKNLEDKLDELASGEINWADAWNYMKNRYPSISNEELDIALRKSLFAPKEDKKTTNEQTPTEKQAGLKTGSMPKLTATPDTFNWEGMGQQWNETKKYLGIK